MALPVSGKTYTFTCVGASPRVLNLYYPNSIANGQNVCLWNPDESLEQQWKYSGGKLLSMRGTSFALDKYTVSGNANNNNADIWTANDPTNQNIIFEAVSGNTVMIKLSSSGLYLTAYNNANGSDTGKKTTSSGNVFWAVKKTDSTNNKPSTMQQWTFKEVGGSSGEKEVIVTGMPESKYYTGGKEYFHPKSGMVNGDWNRANNGATIQRNIQAFYKAVFGVDTNTIDNYCYSLFGSKTVQAGTSFNGTYHHGVDMFYYDGAPVKSAHSGTLIEATGNHIAIYDSTKNVTYLYLHTNIDSSIKGQKLIPITKGQRLGTQSNQGMGPSGPSHLHFEVKSGKNPTPAMPNNDLNTSLPSISPYKYMNV